MGYSPRNLILKKIVNTFSPDLRKEKMKGLGYSSRYLILKKKHVNTFSQDLRKNKFRFCL